MKKYIATAFAATLVTHSAFGDSQEADATRIGDDQTYGSFGGNAAGYGIANEQTIVAVQSSTDNALDADRRELSYSHILEYRPNYSHGYARGVTPTILSAHRPIDSVAARVATDGGSEYLTLIPAESLREGFKKANDLLFAVPEANNVYLAFINENGQRVAHAACELGTGNTEAHNRLACAFLPQEFTN